MHRPIGIALTIADGGGVALVAKGLARTKKTARYQSLTEREIADQLTAFIDPDAFLSGIGTVEIGLAGNKSRKRVSPDPSRIILDFLRKAESDISQLLTDAQRKLRAAGK
jgi:hypothetical protein